VSVRAAGLLGGVLFGFVLGWAHLTDYDVIHKMLLWQEPDVFLLMGSAMATGFVGLRLLRRFGVRTVAGAQPVAWRLERPSLTIVLGSAVFGVGWSLACTCPGPALAQVGRGQLSGLFTSLGLMLGVLAGERLLEWWARRRETAAPSASAAVM
jgi:uncharacterized membrane protein YedE/YeeE